MDTKRIGMFLKQLRNENGMTQEQLGEIIGVSNKTISRWETGNYMPPVDCLNKLSEIYYISINEILAGERVSGDKFTKIAEENITATLKESEKERQNFTKMMRLIYVITTILTIAIMILLPKNTMMDVVVLVLVIAVWFIASTLNITLSIVALEAKKNVFDKNGFKD